MDKYYTPDTFNQDKYKRSGWKIFLISEENNNRLIVRVATGRKYWPIFSLIIFPELGLQDPALKEMKSSLNLYTFPMINRFVEELNCALSDIYKVEVNLNNIESNIRIEGFYYSNNF